MARSLVGIVSGTVVAFDDAAGFGTLRADDAPPGDRPRELFFHCTAIADGSRHIEPGTSVHCTIVPGRLGRWEAADLVPTSPRSVA